MSQIFVCGLDEMATHAARLRPGRLVSLVPEEEQPPTPRGMRAEDHLRVPIHDVDSPGAGTHAPGRHHITALVAFLRATPPEASILIHCLAGVSRSTAAALIALALEAPGRERDAALCLRAASPFADPNRLMIELADDVLERGGKLVAARMAMGFPDWTQDYGLFALPRRLPPRD
jgi:predicted protein tyrosine phosphatase